MGVTMKNGTVKDVHFSGNLENGTLSGTYHNCDFTNLSMRHVTLNGTFDDCKFRPASGVIREGVRWNGTFTGATNGVNEG
jgi:hypothetical protein